MYLLVLRSIFLGSSVIYFTNGSGYLTKRTVQVFISLMRFLLQSLVSRSFFVLLRYSFLLFFSFISAFFMVSASNIDKYLQFAFFLSVLILIWFSSSIHFVVSRFIPPETVSSFQANNRFLLKSQVNTLLVYSCWVMFLFWSVSGSGEFFPSSSIRVCLLILGIYSVVKLIGRG